MWKDCTVNSAYMVSSYGDIMRKSTGKILKQKLDKNNVLLVNLSFGKRGYAKYFMVHKLVAEAFIPNPENKPWVTHIDGNSINNCADNLKWIDSKVQYQPKGENSYNSKLTREEVEYCRKMYKPRDKEFGVCGLAKHFNVATSTMHYILNNVTYK